MKGRHLQTVVVRGHCTEPPNMHLNTKHFLLLVCFVFIVYIVHLCSEADVSHKSICMTRYNYYYYSNE